MHFSLVAIGTSKGGLSALGQLLEGLPQGFPTPLAVVQHRGMDSDELLADLLAERCALHVSEAEDKEPLRPGHVYIAPAGYHLLVDGDHFALSMEAPVGYARPAIDVLFDSAADSLGSRVIGVILTGTGQDGAQGAARIKAAGGRMLVEEPATAEEGAMPEAALRAVRPDVVGDVPHLAKALVKLCARSNGHPIKPAAAAKHADPPALSAGRASGKTSSKE